MFSDFAQKIEANFNVLAKNDLFTVEVDKSEMWNHYLDSFPDGTNPIYIENREHDCNCCKQFIKRVGNVVSITDGQIESVWDVDGVEYPYDIVAQRMVEYIAGRPIINIFLSAEKTVGAKQTKQYLEDQVLNWNHFYCEIPGRFVSNNISETLGHTYSAMKVFKRGLEELAIPAFDDVIDLIDNDSIYRGDEFKISVVEFRKLAWEYKKLNSDYSRNMFIWDNMNDRCVKFRNTVIGTLVVDISGGVELTKAVASFESKVAPTNYKRSSSLITKGMVADAMKTIDKLGIKDSLERRFAVIDDVALNNVLFADRSVTPLMKDSLVEDLLTEVKLTKVSSNVMTMGIEDFISNVVPNVDSIELQMENRQTNNLMSLIAPVHSDSKNIMLWDNKFSWSYNNNVTDSIKEKVARAGGNVNGLLRVSLAWYNTDDLDIHVKEPDGNHIHFGNKCGKLDVDMNVSNVVRNAVENVTWNKLQQGQYQVYINNYTKRESVDVGFTVEMEYDSKITTFTYNKPVRGNGNVRVFDFSYKNGIVVDKIHPDISADSIAVETWGIKTQEFTKVNLMMFSPNFWDDQNNGNKHYFFILDNCLNTDSTRGIYNEFLITVLHKHRKVFEIVGDKTKCEYSESQLSGIGFSSTKRDEVIVRTTGKINRTIKVQF